jgi:hypothetical protein
MKLMRMSWVVLLSCFLCGVAQAATFSGKVVSPDGTPMTGATVWAGAVGQMNYSEKDGTVKRMTTGEDGAFSFDIETKEGIPPFAFVRVKAGKFAIEDTLVKPGGKIIKLTLSTTVRGIVKDAKGEPVPDAVVQAVFTPGSIDTMENELASGGMMVFASLMFWAEALPPIEARSGADGKWSLETSKTVIVSLNDPRFARAFAMGGMPNVRGLENSGFLTLVAQPSTAIKGRLLTEEGNPLKDGYVIGANNIFGVPAKMAADGTFTMEGLPPAPITLIGFSSDADWLIAPLSITKPLEVGKVNEAPAWRASRGVEVTGIVLNKKTGAPVAGAIVMSGVGGGAKSGADGKFKVHLSPQMGMVQIHHPDYAASAKQIAKLGDEKTHDIGQVTLEPTIKFTGRLVDKDGQPLKNLTLMASAKREEGNFVPSIGNATTDDKGAFEMKVAAGPVTMSLQEKEWEFETGRFHQFKLDETTAPLDIKIKKMAPQKVTGRVLRPNGQPVKGATVIAQATMPDPPEEALYLLSNQDKLSGETDAEGRYSIDAYGAIKELKISNVEGEQYLIRQNGVGKKEGNDWKMADTVVALLNATVKGRVLDAKGAPAKGVWVASPEATTFAPIQTDDTGNFTLDKLPEGAAVIFAAQDKNFARGTAEKEKVELKLAQPAVFVAPMRRQFFQQSAKDGIGSLYGYWNFIGSDKMLAYALQADGALPYGETDWQGADWDKAGKYVLQFIVAAAPRDPQWLRKNGLDLLGKVDAEKNEDEQFRAEGALAQVLAFGDEQQRATAKQWLDFESKIPDKRNENVKNAARWFLLAGVAGALGDPRADNWAISALSLADAAGNKIINDNARSWGALLGIGGPKLMASLDAEWPLKARVEALAGAVNALAPFDLKRASALLEPMKELEKDPEYKKQRAAEPNYYPQEQLPSERAETEILQAQAQNDPEGALAATEKSKSIDWDLRGRIARSALRAGKLDVAKQALKPAAGEVGWHTTGTMAGFALMTEKFDKELAAKLWQKADDRLKQSETQNQQQAYRDYSEKADYAFYRAGLNPDLARLRLETTWPEARPGKDEQNRNNRWSHYQLIGAMVALDPVRALEMMAESTDDGRRNARSRIIAYLLADEKERDLLTQEY